LYDDSLLTVKKLERVKRRVGSVQYSKGRLRQRRKAKGLDVCAGHSEKDVMWKIEAKVIEEEKQNKKLKIKKRKKKKGEGALGWWWTWQWWVGGVFLYFVESVNLRWLFQ
jgi:hypothetical protein